jgi:hypothetical protein
MWIIKRERCDEELVAADVGGEGRKSIVGDQLDSCLV